MAPRSPSLTINAFPNVEFNPFYPETPPIIHWQAQMGPFPGGGAIG